MKTLDYPIRVPTDVLEALGEFTGHNWSDSLALEPFICEAIRNYLLPAPAAPTHAAPSSGTGCQLKLLFLPAGTRLRAGFGGRSYFAKVEGDAIQYGGHVMSPSQFANLRGSGNRNAWKAIWLCLPGSEDWLLADVCRAARKAALARLLEGGAHPERPLQAREERRTVERRTTGHTASGKSGCELRQPSQRHGGQRQGDPRQSAPGKNEVPVAWAAMERNGIQFKIEPRRSGRMRPAKYYRPGNPGRA